MQIGSSYMVYSQGYCGQNRTVSGASPLTGVEEETQNIKSILDKEKEESKSLWEMMGEAQEKAEERKKSLQLPKNNSKYGEAAMEAYARLARARTQAQVSSASGYARRRILQFKAEMGRDGENSARIRAAIRQLEKAVKRAGKKKSDLSKEQLVELRRKKAAQREQKEKELKLRQELAHRRAMRSIRESGYSREADIDNRQQEQMAQTRMELREQAQSLASEVKVSSEFAVQQYGMTSGEAVSEPVSEVSVEV